METNNILIVEDDRLLCEAVSDYFTAKGWQTDEAYDGETALEMAEGARRAAGTLCRGRRTW